VVMPRPHGSESLRRYLFCSGALTALLLFDDLFLLHEVIFPIFFGIPDEVMLAIYSVLMLFYLLWFGRLVRQSDFLLFVMALGMFSLSIGIDLVSDDYLWEDGAKFIGIVSWFAYFAHVCAASLKGGFEPSKE